MLLILINLLDPLFFKEKFLLIQFAKIQYPFK